MKVTEQCQRKCIHILKWQWNEIIFKDAMTLYGLKSYAIEILDTYVWMLLWLTHAIQVDGESL